MMPEILLESSITKGLLTTLMALILIGAYLMISKAMHNRESAIKLRWILVFYLLYLIFAIGIALLVAMIWGVSAMTLVNRFIEGAIHMIGDNLTALSGTFVTILVALLVMRISLHTLKKIGAKESPSRQRRQTIARVLQSIIKYTVTIVATIIILSLWGMDVAPALAGLGILGLVIGLGAQRLIADIINGFFIIFEQHFNVGERIEIQGFKGDVIDIGLKTTKVMSWKGEVRIFNNGDISSVTNFSRNFSVAVAPFSISYAANMQETIDLLTASLKPTKAKFPVVLDDPVVLGVMNLNASGVDMQVICKTEAEQHYAIERYLKQHIKEILDKNNIEIPFPHVVVSHKD